MKQYYRVMLGQGSVNAKECLEGGFIGTDYEINEDLTGKLPDNWRDFNDKFIPVYLAARPDKTKIAAGLACGATWTVARGMQKGDVVLCPDGEGNYRVGEIGGDYCYAAGQTLFHRRPVKWLDKKIALADRSEAFRKSAGSAQPVVNLPAYREEIEKLLGGATLPPIISTIEGVEDPSSFALEEHLEDFLIKNWMHTELGKEYDIYQEGDVDGQQYQTDTGPMDILAISKDRKKLLVLELKKGRASDAVVGQTLRYMGYVREELAEEDQTVEGVIIAHEDDARIRRALAMVPAVRFFRYQLSFKLVK
jgi:restriction system protein